MSLPDNKLLAPPSFLSLDTVLSWTNLHTQTGDPASTNDLQNVFILQFSVLFFFYTLRETECTEDVNKPKSFLMRLKSVFRI